MYAGLLVLCLFFLLVGDHRYLHSFPTRRSSDLRGRARKPARSDRVCAGIRRRVDRGRARGGTAALLVRSEEHTSELQSQFHLVCRLLLEKKNTSQALIVTV